MRLQSPGHDEITDAPQVTGALVSKNAGGNPSMPTFLINPQYYLRIHPATSANANSTQKSQLLVELTGNRNIPLNVSIVWSQGQRITESALR